ncbi:hypothetical protein BCEN4_620052 [Burkholderia cenocepacia]|nr:hypothetical protein BCEN4_620052 [Burkholderia cenocepacia]
MIASRAVHAAGTPVACKHDPLCAMRRNRGALVAIALPSMAATPAAAPFLPSFTTSSTRTARDPRARRRCSSDQSAARCIDRVRRTVDMSCTKREKRTNLRNPAPIRCNGS